MSTNSELEAQIAALTGRIDWHKTHHQESVPSSTSSRGRYQGYRGRWPRGGRHQAPFRNMSLVNTNQDVITTAPANGINKQHHLDYQKHRLIQRGVRRVDPPSRTVDIQGIKFEMKEDGSKLTRVEDPTNTTRTPRSTILAGVTFLRSKNGNLLRQMDPKAVRYRIASRSDIGYRYSSAPRSRPAQVARSQCEIFTKNGTCHNQHSSSSFATLRRLTGTCKFGPKCHYAHDPTKVAVCKTFLRTGSCPNGDRCDMSHTLSYHRVSACTHFQHDACNNEDCRYPHVRVPVAALVCRPFATLGYCDKGEKCDDRHVSECPDYANTGECPQVDNCPLPHIIRASKQKQPDVDSEIESVAGDDSEDMVDHESVIRFENNDDFIALA